MATKITKEAAAHMVAEFIDTNTSEIEFDGYSIHVNAIVDKAVAETIISGVLEGCFGDDGRYDPVTKEFLKKILVLTAYTDIELPDTPSDKYVFIYGTDIFDIVVQSVNPVQLSEIFDAIDECVEHRIRMGADTIANSMMQLYAEVSSIASEFKNLYGNITGEQMTEFVKAISDSKLDEKKLVGAITSAKE